MHVKPYGLWLKNYFQPPVNFCSDENIQTIFGIKLKDFLFHPVSNFNTLRHQFESGKTQKTADAG
jgi:hypothetical protein